MAAVSCLGAAGWRVVRLRLGVCKRGEWDLVSDSGTLTLDAVPALVEAIGDAVAARQQQLILICPRLVGGRH